MSYQIDIAIDAADVDQIEAAEQAIAFVKNPTAGQPIAWLTLPPAETISLSWTTDYGFYYASAPPANGKPIAFLPAAPTPAELGTTYRFSGGAFTHHGKGAPGAYSLQNADFLPFHFGLGQEAEVDGAAAVFAPVIAVHMPYNQTCTFTPREMVAIFLTRATGIGVPLLAVPSNALVLTFPDGETTATITFDDATGTFWKSEATPVLPPALLPDEIHNGRPSAVCQPGEAEDERAAPDQRIDE